MGDEGWVISSTPVILTHPVGVAPHSVLQLHELLSFSDDILLIVVNNINQLKYLVHENLLAIDLLFSWNGLAVGH